MYSCQHPNHSYAPAKNITRYMCRHSAGSGSGDSTKCCCPFCGEESRHLLSTSRGQSEKQGTGDAPVAVEKDQAVGTDEVESCTAGSRG